MQLSTGTYILTCGVVLLCTAAADDVIVPSNEVDNYYDERGKRPFCNAFTGCGKKRAADPVVPLSTLVDMNAEPAVADLSRQILSEAKLWEAMQEAQEELRQYRMAAHLNRRLSPAGLNGLQFFRKRRSVQSAAAQSVEE